MATPTVVIVAYRSGRDLPDCLAALRETRGGAPPLVVVENACPERSGDLAERHYPGARLLRLPRNLGFAGGANAGIRAVLDAGGGEVVLLNPDTVPEPGWWEALDAAAAADPGAGILGSLLLAPGGAALEDSQRRAILTASIPRRTSVEPLGDGPIEMASVIGAAMWIRRPVIEALGGLDPTFFLYGEETDYCTRARARGFRILLVPASRVVHRVMGSQVGAGLRLRARWLLARNDGLLLLKRPGLGLGTGVLDLPFRAGRLCLADLRAGRPLDALLRAASLPVLLALLPRVARVRRREAAGPTHLGAPGEEGA